MANPLLHHFIQLSFIIDFKLNEYPILDRPFVLCCNVSIEPADMTYIMKLILGQLRGRSRQGLPGDAASQEIRLSECTRGIDDTRMEIWKNAKKGATEKGFTNAPMGVVDFAVRGSEQTIPCAVMITEDLMERLKAGVGFEMESALMPGRNQVSLSRESFINMHIRSDKKNQLRLRAHMNQADIDKLRSSDDAE